MKQRESVSISDGVAATVDRKAGLAELLGITGEFTVECRDRDGNLKWSDTFENLVVTVGRNLMLATLMQGAAYSVTGPFMGLISSDSYSTIALANTMASHAGWLEAGNAQDPTYSGNRKTAVFSAPASGVIALSAPLTFSITSAGTVKGAFLVLGTGAVNTIDSTAGVLFSAALFTGGDKVVDNGDTLNVSYSCTLS